MAKVVFNGCYGGFSLSDAAIQRYADLKGIAIHKHTVGDTDYSLWVYAKTDVYLDPDDFARHDPILVQVVEELGLAADGDAARLRIREVPDGAHYRIVEYDGMESVILESELQWETADG